jgi:hypothetical protein
MDKDFVYQVINELRIAGKDKSTDDKILMLAAANVMENLIRSYLDLLTEGQQK